MVMTHMTKKSCNPIGNDHL